MGASPAMFLFLAATIVAVFAFLSIAVWVSGPAQERQARDRLALLKTVAEQPGQNAAAVLELLREEDRRRVERNERERRRGLMIGGLSAAAAGVGLGLMLELLHGRQLWSIGLIPFLIGCVLVGAGLLTRRAE